MTGLVKGYEVCREKAIREDVKQVGNEEVVSSCKLGECMGKEKGCGVIGKMKDEIGKKGVGKRTKEVEEKVDE
ncbi:DUF1002 domain-containing protein, partial [Bacillus sp. WP8]|uniref:DUF1002 domain-containing protein n=1 Tax=Bacillus sp. WP8 TaxID=756828 RepID=UPI0021B3E69C